MGSYVQNILDKVDDYRYTPLTVELFNDNGIEMGDVIRVYYDSTNYLDTYVFNKKSTNSGITLSSTGRPDRDVLVNGENNEVQALVGKYHTIENTVNAHTQTLGDLSTDTSTTFKITADGVHIEKTVAGQTASVDFDGGHISADSIDASTILVDGSISFDKLSADTKSRVGNIYRKNTIPTAEESVLGSYWYVTGTVSGHPEYYVNSWYTYNGTSWVLTSNPSYITATRITSTTIETPTIIGNDIIVRGDTEGAFRIQTTVDGQVVDLGRMGAGTQFVDGESQQGILISNNTNYDEGSITEVGDNWVSIVPGEVRMCYSWYEGEGQERVARYRSIFINEEGAWYDDGIDTVVPIGPAVFL